MTLVTSIDLAHFDFFFDSESGFLERDLHVVTQVASTLAAVGLGRAAAEKGLENSAAATCAAKNFAKDIKWIVEPTAAAALGKGGMSIAIVGGAFLFVDEDVVSFAKLLEFLFRVRVVGILIGVKFDRELAIGALDFIRGGIALDAQDVVVVAFRGHERRTKAMPAALGLTRCSVAKEPATAIFAFFLGRCANSSFEVLRYLRGSG